MTGGNAHIHTHTAHNNDDDNNNKKWNYFNANRDKSADAMTKRTPMFTRIPEYYS